MLNRSRVLIAIALLAGAAVLAFLLLEMHHGGGRAAADALCGAAGTSGCDVVNQSRWAEVAGVPVAAAGLFFYASLTLLLALALLAGDETRATGARIVFLALCFSLLVDAGLFVVQAALLKAYCVLCLTTYALGAAALVALLPARRAAGSLLPTSSSEGRFLLAGWGYGSLALVAAVWAAHLALSAGKPTGVALLGAPATAAPAATAPAPTPVPAAGPAAVAPPAAASASDSDDLQRARAEVKRLQETLDDPQKLEQYFSAKAARDFDQAPVLKFDLGGVPFKGPASAPIRVVEYSDFLCPYCRSLAGAFTSYIPTTANRVAIYFKNYPLDPTCNENLKQAVHPGACFLALAAICANEQGKFWPYHDRVFSIEAHSVTKQDVLQLASDAGADPTLLDGCMQSPATQQRLRSEIREAAAAGLKGTPTLFINGRLVSRLNDFVAMVERESARLGLPPLAPPKPAK
jgi:protein-disulfide isomerase/uncharacterized membrane protein